MRCLPANGFILCNVLQGACSTTKDEYLLVNPSSAMVTPWTPAHFIEVDIVATVR